MRLYWIKDKEGQYWCNTKMKPSNLPDIQKSYSVQGYWSRFSDDYCIKRRVKYLYIFGKLTQLFMKLLSNINTDLVIVQIRGGMSKNED